MLSGMNDSTGRTYFRRISCMGILILFLIASTGCFAAPTENSQPPDTLPTLQTAGVPENLDPGLIRYAVFPAPPYMIGVGEENSAISGIDVEIVQEIALRMNLKIEFIPCTWARCLELMKSGEADLISSAYKKPDREEYMTYLLEPFLDKLPIAFYFLKGKNYSVVNYEDIYQFNSIGVLNGASYFERFDQDARAGKFPVPSQDQLFPMLLAGRLDAVAGYVPTENYRITIGGYRDQIERSEYEYQEQALVYMAISKKAQLVARIDQINQINHQLIAEGFISKIVNRYYEKYH